jgi:GntR family transcriptional regulator
MTAGVDPLSDRPVYRQIADYVRALITSGELAPGDQIPSERELIEQFGASRGTIRQAIGQLRAEGLIEVEHGRGAYVRSRPPVRRLAFDRFARRHRKAGKAAYLAEMEGEGRQADVEIIRVGREPSPADPAERLGLREGDPVLVRARRYLSDGQPMEIATSYVPWMLAEGTPMTDPNPGPGGIYARLEENGHELGSFIEDVVARMPTPEESRALRLPVGIPVLQLVRTAFDQDGTPVEVCDTVMAADRYVLSYRLPAD